MYVRKFIDTCVSMYGCMSACVLLCWRLRARVHEGMYECGRMCYVHTVILKNVRVPSAILVSVQMTTPGRSCIVWVWCIVGMVYSV